MLKLTAFFSVLLTGLLAVLGARAQQQPTLRESYRQQPGSVQFAPMPISTARQTDVNTCNTWTFKKRYGRALTSELPNDATVLPGNTYVIGGADSSATGFRGRLVKLDANGALLGSKTLAFGTLDVAIKTVRYFSNGNLYALGETHTHGSPVTRPFIAALDANLNLLASYSLDVSGIAGSWTAVGLVEGSADAEASSMLVMLSNDSLINISRVSLGGSVTWSKCYRTRNKPTPIDIGFEDRGFFSYNETDSGYRKGVVAGFDYQSGNIIYSFKIGGGRENAEYIFQSMQVTNLRPRVTAVRIKNGSTQYVRVSYSPNSVPEYLSLYSFANPVPALDMSSVQNRWSEVQALTSAPDALGQKVELLYDYVDNYSDPIRIQQIGYAYPLALKKLLLTFDGGSLILGRTASGLNEIVVTKTDSIGTLPICTSTPQTASFVREESVSARDTLNLRAGGLQLTSDNYVLADVATATTEECATTYCPPSPNPDTCLRTFSKEYRNNTNTILMDKLAVTNGKLLMSGFIRDNPYQAIDYPVVAVLDTNGKLLDAQVIRTNYRMLFQKVVRLGDGNFVGAGYIYYKFDSLDQVVIKFDPSLNIIWQKKMNTLTVRHQAIGDVIASAEGDIYCYVLDNKYPGSQKRYLLKLDANGEPVWLHNYDAGSSVFFNSSELNPKLVELGDYIYMKLDDQRSIGNPSVIKIRKSDGGVAWLKKYTFIPNGNYTFQLWAFMSDGSNLYMTGVEPSQNRSVIIKVNPNGDIIHSVRISDNRVHISDLQMSGGTRIIAPSSGYLYANASVYGAFQLDTALHIVQRQFMQMGKFGYVYSVAPYSDSVFYNLSNFFYNNAYWASVGLQKFNFQSSFGSCAMTDFVPTLDPYTVQVQDGTTFTIATELPVTQPLGAVIGPTPFGYSAFYCGSNPLCSSFSLTGPSTICDAVNTYTFTGHRSPGCKGVVVWEMDTVPGMVHITAMTDTTISVKISTAGQFKVRGKVFGNCTWMKDSVLVSGSVGTPPVLNLGPDATICPGNQIILNTHGGFSSYLWNNGATDSAITVTQPGTYTVEAKSCGNSFYDTVVVTAAPPIPFDAGPDRVKCPGDTVRLNAPSGFLNYAWTDDQDANTLTAQNPTVQATNNVHYYVRAEKTPGCFAFDTLLILVHAAPPIYLGRDTSFCEGQSVVFDAGSGFTQYSWSNGSTTQQLTASTAGTYSVTGTTVDGCKSRDTILITGTWPRPSVAISGQPTICTGSTVTLDAGARPGYASYIWNDGSTDHNLVVSAIGNYGVTVTTDHGCTGSASFDVTAILPLPAGFLPVDTSVCPYDKITLRPSSLFTNYLWSTNETGSSISVSKPGVYWLQVQDGNGCRGRDTLLVYAKECPAGLFVPGAFTPNGDGLNDLFKPLLYGDVLSFRFTVYNRWGQVVFQSNDPKKGWDGMVKGKPQDTNAYVWLCTYQLAGQELRTARGTVVLIH